MGNIILKQMVESSLSDQVEALIQSEKIVVFSKSYCPHCTMSKQLFQKGKIDGAIVELDKINDGPAIQNILQQLTGQRTVPNIFINGQHIGGNSELQGMKKTGQLKTRLNEAGVSHKI